MSLIEHLHTPRPGWTAIGPAVHPTERRAGALSEGMLCRHDATGRYVLDYGGTLRNVPQDWARATAAALGQPEEPEPKDTARTFRLTRRSADLLAEMAAARGASQAELLEELIREAASEADD